jgi:hypothetical protein
MARLFTTGFELQSLTNGVEFDTMNPQTAAIETSVVRSGAASLHTVQAANTSFITQTFFGTAQNTTRYLRVYIYVHSRPIANLKAVLLMRDNTNGNGPIVYMNTDGTLSFYDAQSGVQQGSNSSALALDTWYRLEIAYTYSNGAIEAKLDGSTWATGSSTASMDMNVFRMGLIDSTTADIYWDDVAVNDATGSFQNTWPGSGKVIVLRPNNSGDVNTFATQTGGTAGAANNYTRINQTTPDDATTFNGSSTLNQEDLVNLDPSGLSSSDTINVAEVWARFRNSTADTTGAIKFEIEKVGSGTIQQSAAIVPNSTTWRTNSINGAVFRVAPLVTYQNPDSVAWTNSTLDTAQIGYKLTTGPGTAGRRIDVSYMGLMVDYTPSSVTTTPQTITGVARILKVVLQTITGLARITASTTQTLTGKARITASTSQTITGKSRVTATTSQTIQGKADILRTTSQTTTGKSRVTRTVLQTISGVSRITAAAARTITGLARITASTARTITGKAAILRTTSQTTTGVSRIQVSVTKTITGTGRLSIGVNQTITGKSRVTVQTSQTLLGKADVQKSTTRTTTGVSRIQRSVAQTTTGLARILQVVARTITGLARVTNATTRTITGKADILKTTSQTITGKSTIGATTTKTVTGKSRLQKSAVQTIQGLSRITQIVLKTLTGKSRITIQTQRTLLATSRIQVAATKTLTGQSRITQIVPKNLQGLSRIQLVTTQTLTGKANVLNSFATTQRTITGVAHICVDEWEQPSNPSWQEPVGTGWQHSNVTSPFIDC